MAVILGIGDGSAVLIAIFVAALLYVFPLADLSLVDIEQYLAYGAGVAVYNVTLHPLAKFPGPILQSAFKFPMLWSLFKGTATHETKELHIQYGDVVRIAPDHLSFNTAQAWKDIYGTRLGKKQLEKDDEWFVDHKQPVNIISMAFTTLFFSFVDQC